MMLRPLTILAALVIMFGCQKELSLKAHNTEYATGKVNKSLGVDFFSTTKEHLIVVWGPQKKYCYLGSDNTQHYLIFYYNNKYKKMYYYSIPKSTPIGNNIINYTPENIDKECVRMIFL